MKKRKIIVKTVRRMPPGKNSLPGMKGNICINEDRKFDAAGKLTADNSVYLSQRDYRNGLLALDLNGDIVCTKLVGATIEYDERIITAEELVAAGGSIKGTSNGRELEWKTAGLKQYNHRIVSMADFALSETDEINQRMNETTMKRLREQSGAPVGPRRPQIEQPVQDAEVIDTDVVDDPIVNDDVINDPVKDEEAKAKADADAVING